MNAFLLSFLSVAVLPFASAHAQEKLLLVGGGNLPGAAVARFCDWAGRATGRVLVITWATTHPDSSFQDVNTALAPCSLRSVTKGPDAPLTASSRADLLSRLGDATAVFFTGGDQNRIMDVLKDPELLSALRLAYERGLPFGGTSAGTAIMSPLMITGDGDPTVIDGDQISTRAGLGLLPGVILDTHFVRRQRENRLFGLVLKHPQLLGIGIDEDTAISVSGGIEVETSGRGQVLLIRASGSDGGEELKIQLLHAGERARLDSR
jgi:cyanophycinase